MRDGLVRLAKRQIRASKRGMSRQERRVVSYRLLQEGQGLGGLLRFREDVTEVVIQLGRFRVGLEQLLEKLARALQIGRLEERDSELLFDGSIIRRESESGLPVLHCLDILPALKLHLCQESLHRRR